MNSDDAASPAAPVALSDLLKPPAPAAPQPTMTPEQAARQKLRMVSDPAFRDAVAKGEPQATRKWKAVLAALSPPVDQATAEGRQYARNIEKLAYFRANGDLSPEVLDQVAA